MPKFPKEIEYSDTYNDDAYFYRNVRLPQDLYKKIPKGKIMTEDVWRSLGIKSSKGWQHFYVYKPEPFIIMLRKPVNFQN
ncbi:cyclin-dependent kinase regulatory subunit (macronuclear) [Tetrahymena thermophila SB210]|uniref:Cyclin-dependent kinases regulatory subunit n=1 Tax=Tetrahymena thermophila (strain SB210) TaxID=312017 RepID=Q23VW4_TETTS|nr:cyclin-dependent kinase regulatory subunit [Tetrahymena thermophila SB210]EAS00741.1 cyclin-dependent kinase regulatory subunit [Tetrahymena thermophila SB210]|eukprot:XP_001020986.1 cyclin-dependent kinase regulatory subunit [Tetrahymena thermophila SB210]